MRCASEFESVSDQNSHDHRPTAMAIVKFPDMKSDKHQNIGSRWSYFSDHEGERIRVRVRVRPDKRYKSDYENFHFLMRIKLLMFWSILRVLRNMKVHCFRRKIMVRSWRLIWTVFCTLLIISKKTHLIDNFLFLLYYSWFIYQRSVPSSKNSFYS